MSLLAPSERVARLRELVIDLKPPRFTRQPGMYVLAFCDRFVFL
jgi:hypothetical protein